MPTCPRCKVAYLDAESHKCAQDGSLVCFIVGLVAAVATLVLIGIFYLGFLTSVPGLIMAFGAATIVGFVAGAIASWCVGVPRG